MDSVTENIIGLIIGGIAVAGGLVIGAITIAVTTPWAYKEKLAKLESKSKERLVMIEKGIDPNIIFRESKRSGQDPMLWGLLLSGMGLGVLLGYLLHLVTDWDQVVLINATAILFGGIGLIAFSVFRRRSGDKTSA